PAARGTDHPILSSRASSAASLPPVRRPNHASRFEGIAKTNLQASTASDTETLQSQVNKAAKKRLSLSELEILHGRLNSLGEVQCVRGTSLSALKSVPARHLSVSPPSGREEEFFLFRAIWQNKPKKYLMNRNCNAGVGSTQRSVELLAEYRR